MMFGFSMLAFWCFSGGGVVYAGLVWVVLFSLWGFVFCGFLGIFGV